MEVKTKKRSTYVNAIKEMILSDVRKERKKTTEDKVTFTKNTKFEQTFGKFIIDFLVIGTKMKR